MNKFYPNWDKGSHYPEQRLLFIEKERSRRKSGTLRPEKRVMRVIKVRPGQMDCYGSGNDREQWVTCQTAFRGPKGRDYRYRWPLTRFRELFEPYKSKV